MGLISRVSSRTYRRKQESKMSEGRLYVRGVFTGYSRGLKTQSMNQAIVKLEGVNDAAGCQWYLGKRVAFVHKAAKNTKIVNGEKKPKPSYLGPSYATTWPKWQRQSQVQQQLAIR